MIVQTLITLILSMLPIEDSNAKMQLGMILSELTHGDYINWIKNKLRICRKKQITVPSKTADSDRNPLFEKLQHYLTLKYSKSIESCELIPKNGDVEYSLKDITGKEFVDDYTDIQGNDHVLNISLQMIQEDTKQGGRGLISHIVISSKTASPDNIKAYVKKISSVQLKNTNLINIYRPIIQGKKKDERTIEWESVTVRTNKTLENTIYSEEVSKELFEDLDKFMNNEDWYSKRGIPYKRGYFLHSTPGQGKTSVAKIIANKYGTPIFCLDLTIIDDNATMTKLMTELNYHAHQSKYILLIEDAERTDFFNPRNRNPKLSMDCFLNVLDGVVEPHGRIIIMSANDPYLILENTAVMRPGRIDKTLELKHCDKYQIRKMYELFYSDAEIKVNWDDWEFNQDLSAAYIMKLLQENVSSPDAFMRLIGNAKTGDDKDITLDDTFKNAKQKHDKEKHNDDVTKHGRGRRRRGYTKASDIKGRVSNIKRTITRAKYRAVSSAKILAQAESKLPILLKKLKDKTEKEKTAKLKKKAAVRIAYLKNKATELRVQEQLEEYCEEEYETPAFLMNTIEERDVPAGTITTYDVPETDDFVPPILPEFADDSQTKIIDSQSNDKDEAKTHNDDQNDTLYHKTHNDNYKAANKSSRTKKNKKLQLDSSEDEGQNSDNDNSQNSYNHSFNDSDDEFIDTLYDNASRAMEQEDSDRSSNLDTNDRLNIPDLTNDPVVPNLTDNLHDNKRPYVPPIRRGTRRS